MKKFHSWSAVFGSFAVLFAHSAVAQTPPEAQDGTTIVQSTDSFRIEKLATGGQSIPDNAYTRLVIEADPEALKTLGYGKRSAFWRLAAGKKYSYAAVLKAQTGRFSDTIPIYGRDYESSRKIGESFERKVSGDILAFPYFLVGSEASAGIVSFVFDANMTETTGTEISANTLGVVRNLLKAVAPSSSVVTTLTADSSRSVADKIDGQVNKLFGTSMAEGKTFDLNMRTTNSYRITVYAPYRELNEMEYDRTVGRWTLSVAQPRASMFVESECSSSCDWSGAFEGATANPSNVLQFKLVDQIGDQGDVAAYLQARDWWTETVSSLEDGNNQEKDFGKFCNKIRDAIQGLGFNFTDGTIVAASVHALDWSHPAWVHRCKVNLPAKFNQLELAAARGQCARFSWRSNACPVDL